MKQQVKDLFAGTLAKLVADGLLPGDGLPNVKVERTRDERHGDFSSNAALVLAKRARTKPRELAACLIEALPPSPLVERVELAGPGFINVFLAPAAYRALVPEILATGPDYGRSDIGTGKRVQVEFVSANPTGPLHVGHGRGAAYGAVVADLLAAVGFQVHREYYVNDAGRQMDILAISVWLRYLELCGEAPPSQVTAIRVTMFGISRPPCIGNVGTTTAVPAASSVQICPSMNRPGATRRAISMP